MASMTAVGAAAAAVGASLLLANGLSFPSPAQMEAAPDPEAPAAAPAAGDKDKDKFNEVLPMREVMTLIETGLKEFRSKRFFGGSLPSSSSFSSSSSSQDKKSTPTPTTPSSLGAYPKIAVLSKGKGVDEPFTIEIPLPARLGNEAKVLTTCLQALQQQGHTLTFHTGLATPEATNLSFILNDGLGSVLLTSSTPIPPSRSPSSSPPSSSSPISSLLPPPPKASLLLYKTNGFTHGDVNAVITSYITAWTPTHTHTHLDHTLPYGANSLLMGFADLLDALRNNGGGPLISDKDLFGFFDPASPSSPFHVPSGGGTIDRHNTHTHTTHTQWPQQQQQQQ
jgi:hypothetical protein